LRQTQASWDNHIDILQQLIDTYYVIGERRRKVFFRVVDAIKELKGPSILHRDKVLIREEFVDKLKTTKSCPSILL
jgi:hypothetical protein